MSSSNSRSPPPPSTSIRSAGGASALGVTPGWGIGMSNSASYTSTSTRNTCTIALPAEESTIHDAIRRIVRKKKIWEASAMKAAKLKQEQKMAQANDKDIKERERSDKEAKNAAAAKATELRNRLNKLFLQQTELEKNVQYQWKEKVNDFEQRSLKEEEDELNKLRGEQKQLIEKMRIEHEIVEEKKVGSALSETRKGKRKAERPESEESHKKRLQVGNPTTGKGKRGGDQAGHHAGMTESTTANVKGGGGDKDVVGDEIGNGDVDKGVLHSAKKDKELEKIVNEMNYLNKTKSQMIWLLKQVITAEKKLKL